MSTFMNIMARFESGGMTPSKGISNAFHIIGVLLKLMLAETTI